MHRVVGGRDADGEAQSESLSGGDLSSGGASSAESIALESGSSFGSTSSSASSSNLTSLKAQVEDANGGGNLQDSKVSLLSSDSFTSDNSITSAISLPLAATCQDPVVHVSLLENCLSRKPLESESKISVSSSRVHTVSGFPLPLQVNQLQQQQVQFVQVGANYIPHNTEGVVPVSSYYPLYQAQPQQQLHYRPNQVCPVYFVPVGQMAPYDLPGQCGLVNTVAAAYQPPLHSNASLVASQVAYKEATVAPAKPDSASKVCRSGQAHVATPLVRDHHEENQKQPMRIPQMRHQPQSIPVPSRESANFSNELDDDPACFQIYKSQPPPPF